MIKSPLTLEMYFFTNIRMEAQTEAEGEIGEGVIRTYLHSSQHEEDPRSWRVILGLKQSGDKEKGCPYYTFLFEVAGLFSVDEDYPAEKTEQLIRVNGAAVLYGAIREMAANLSARGPYPSITLPTVTFLDEAQSEGNEAKKKSRTGEKQGKKRKKAHTGKG